MCLWITNASGGDKVQNSCLSIKVKATKSLILHSGIPRLILNNPVSVLSFTDLSVMGSTETGISSL